MLRNFLTEVVFVIGRERRKRWLFLIVLAAAVSLVEALAALCIALLLSTLVSPDQTASLPVLGVPLPSLQSTGGRSALLLAAVLGSFFAARGLLVLAQVYLQSRIGHNTGVEISRRLMDGYLRMPYEFHLKRNTSELVRNAYTTAAEVVVYVLVPLVQGASEVLVMIGLGAVLVAAAPQTALLAGLALGVGVYQIQRVVRPRLRNAGVESQAYLASTLESLQYAIGGVREIRLLRTQEHFLSRFLEKRRGLARANYMRSTVSEFPRVVIETALVIVVALLLVAALAANQSPREALTVIGLFGYAAFRSVPSINRLVSAVNNCRFGAAPLAIVVADLRFLEEGDWADDGAPVEGKVESIELESVSFAYEAASQPVLSNFTLTIEAGQTIGIAGGTGSGKSTLVHILAGFLTPNSGTIRVNGKALPKEGWAWSGQFGFVPQEVFLLNDSVQRNIALGVDDDAIDDDRLRRAIRLTDLEEVIAGLSEGISTIVGDSGARLSGGQRQRIAIARALYRSADLLVLDEGTSALDLITEQRILQGLSQTDQPRTIIHVAHRLTSLKECDRVLVLEGGELVDEGTFSELSTRNEAFAMAARAH